MLSNTDKPESHSIASSSTLRNHHSPVPFRYFKAEDENIKIPTDVLSLWIGSLQLNQCSITKLRVQLIHPHFQNSFETSRVSITPFSPGTFKGTVLCAWAYLYTEISPFAHCLFKPWVSPTRLEYRSCRWYPLYSSPSWCFVCRELKSVLV